MELMVLQGHQRWARIGGGNSAGENGKGEVSRPRGALKGKGRGAFWMFLPFLKLKKSCLWYFSNDLYLNILPMVTHLKHR